MDNKFFEKNLKKEIQMTEHCGGFEINETAVAFVNPPAETLGDEELSTYTITNIPAANVQIVTETRLTSLEERIEAALNDQERMLSQLANLKDQAEAARVCSEQLLSNNNKLELQIAKVLQQQEESTRVSNQVSAEFRLMEIKTELGHAMARLSAMEMLVSSQRTAKRDSAVELEEEEEIELKEDKEEIANGIEVATAEEMEGVELDGAAAAVSDTTTTTSREEANKEDQEETAAVVAVVGSSMDMDIKEEYYNALSGLKTVGFQRTHDNLVALIGTPTSNSLQMAAEFIVRYGLLSPSQARELSQLSSSIIQFIFRVAGDSLGQDFASNLVKKVRTRINTLLEKLMKTGRTTTILFERELELKTAVRFMCNLYLVGMVKESAIIGFFDHLLKFAKEELGKTFLQRLLNSALKITSERLDSSRWKDDLKVVAVDSAAFNLSHKEKEVKEEKVDEVDKKELDKKEKEEKN